jgi:hypothetical protein
MPNDKESNPNRLETVLAYMMVGVVGASIISLFVVLITGASGSTKREFAVLHAQAQLVRSFPPCLPSCCLAARGSSSPYRYMPEMQAALVV